MLPDVGSLMGYLRRLAPPAEGDADGVLLVRFAEGDEAAFAALFRRHAALVWGVCQRALPMAHDAEDAFQAVFVVLARKAGALRRSEPLGPWLHRVAWRTAQKAKARRIRVEAVEETAYTMDPAAGLLRRERRGLIDEEIDRLPARYRQPVLLCLVEGMTNEQAARRIGCPVGTVQSRLSRARDRLREALRRRGVDGPAALGGLAGPTVPARLLESPLPSVASSATVSALAKGVLLTMTLKRFEVVLILLALTVVGSGAWFGTRPGVSPLAAQVVKPDAADKDKKPEPPKPPEPKKEEEKQPAVVERPLADSLPKIRKVLDTKIEFVQDDREMTLRAVLELLEKRYRVQFSVDEVAFMNPNRENVLETKIGEIGPMHTSLDRVLQKVLSRVGGMSRAMYLVRNDCLEITTEKAAWDELGIQEKKAPKGPIDPVTGLRAEAEEDSGEIDSRKGLLPLISEDFMRADVKDVLKKFAETSGYNVILDPRAEQDKDPNRAITARLLNVPVDVAIHLVAEMLDLTVVRQANVFFVTTEKTAEKMRKAQAKEASTLGGRSRRNGAAAVAP